MKNNSNKLQIFHYYFYRRELLLNNNLLRVIPNEIGKLFHIHILGLHGNPLAKDLLSIYNEPNGTPKLLTYLLDNLSGMFDLLIEFEANGKTKLKWFSLLNSCSGSTTTTALDSTSETKSI